MPKGSRINFEQLQLEIRSLKRWHPLYKLLKRELTKLGYWKLQKRGNPQKAYKFGWGKRRNRE